MTRQHLGDRIRREQSRWTEEERRNFANYKPFGDEGNGKERAKPSFGQEPREKTSRIKLVPFDEISVDTCRPYLVKGLIPRSGLAVIWGPPKSGKSFWTFDLVMHIALGWNYRGRRVQQGPVVYCAFEGQSGVKRRVEAFRLSHLAEQAEGVPFYLEPVILDLVKDCRELVAAIHATLGDTVPIAVVLDTLNRSLRGSESSDEDMSAYVGAADALREAFDCAVLIVHHCGVNETRPRGHTSLTGAVDAQLAVKRDVDGNISVTVEWMKDGEGEGDTVGSRLETVEVGMDEDGEAITSCVIVPAEVATIDRQGRATGATKVALDLLRRAVCEAGETPPASNHIKPDIRAVRVDLWRNYCYDGSIAGVDTPDARRKAFARASQKLLSIGSIGKWGEWVWPI
jgi:hypothetical protein